MTRKKHWVGHGRSGQRQLRKEETEDPGKEPKKGHRVVRRGPTLKIEKFRVRSTTQRLWISVRKGHSRGCVYFVTVNE